MIKAKHALFPGKTGDWRMQQAAAEFCRSGSVPHLLCPKRRIILPHDSSPALGMATRGLATRGAIGYSVELPPAAVSSGLQSLMPGELICHEPDRYRLSTLDLQSSFRRRHDARSRDGPGGHGP